MLSFIVLLLAFVLHNESNPILPNIHYEMSKSSLLKAYPKNHFRSSKTFDKTFLDSTQFPGLEILYCDKFTMFGVTGKLGAVFSKGQLQYASWATPGYDHIDLDSLSNKMDSLLNPFGDFLGEAIGYNGHTIDRWITLDNKELLMLVNTRAYLIYSVYSNTPKNSDRFGFFKH